jgi:hypothetical protein
LKETNNVSSQPYYQLITAEDAEMKTKVRKKNKGTEH